MPDILEELALSGVLFETEGPPSRPHSPVSRTPSPNTDDELFGDLSREASPEIREEDVASESIGMGPGRTGVKGVIRDRDEARERDRVRQASALREMRRKMEKAAITGKTFFEEEDDRHGQKAKEEANESDSESDNATRRRQTRPGGTVSVRFPGTLGGGETRDTKYGYLREVGVSGFVQAVEQVDRTVWVVVHLYHPVRLSSSSCCSV